MEISSNWFRVVFDRKTDDKVGSKVGTKVGSKITPNQKDIFLFGHKMNVPRCTKNRENQ